MRAFRYYITFLMLLATIPPAAQNRYADSLRIVLAHHPVPDTFRINRLLELATYGVTPGEADSMLNVASAIANRLRDTDEEVSALCALSRYKGMDEGIRIARHAVELAKKTGRQKPIILALLDLAHALRGSPDPQEPHELCEQALKLALPLGDAHLIALCEISIAHRYGLDNNSPLALEWLFKALHTAEQVSDSTVLPDIWADIGAEDDELDDLETAAHYFKKALAAKRAAKAPSDFSSLLTDVAENARLRHRYAEAVQYYQEAIPQAATPFGKEVCESNLADIYARMGNYPTAFAHCFTALATSERLKFMELQSWITGILGRIHLQLGHPDSALYYGKKGFAIASAVSSVEFARDNADVLAKAFEAKRNDSAAFRYYKIFITLRDSMANNDISNKGKLVQYNYDLGKKQSEIDLLNKDRQLQQAEARRQRTALISALAGLALVGVVLFLIARNNRQRRRAYGLLQRQKQEIQDQRDQTAQALRELRQTQQQLIQSEKMASLGELTAGVAHEIQNPLNFVNNFAELNIELLAELKAGPLQALSGPTKEEADGLIADISDNLAKIAWHGGRAGAIVKGMLAHSRTGSGAKEPTDLNALADECLRLSYHGYRAKQKSFNANLVTNFDPAVGLVDLVPQDIGRVLLNLCTNAFYSLANKSERAESGYQPTVALTTNREGGNIVIMVRDNGLGIPAAALDKIYQPFFTTKPSGEGTGLGLSLSYDIVTKGHGGTIKVDTKESEYTQFTIKLPI